MAMAIEVNVFCDGCNRDRMQGDHGYVRLMLGEGRHHQHEQLMRNGWWSELIGEPKDLCPKCITPPLEDRRARWVALTNRIRPREVSNTTTATATQHACCRGHVYTDTSFVWRTKANGTQFRECLQCRKVRDNNRNARQRARTAKGAPPSPVRASMAVNRIQWLGDERETAPTWRKRMIDAEILRLRKLIRDGEQRGFEGGRR